MAETDVPSALSFMGMTGSTPFDAPEVPAVTPSPQKTSRKRRRMATPEEVAAALPELQSRCSRIVFDDRRGEEGTNLLNLLKVYQHWYEESVPGPASATLDERILHVEKVGGSHSVRNALMQLGGRAVARERKQQSKLSSSEAAVAATRAEVVDEAEKSRSALFFGGVFEGETAPVASGGTATLDEAAMKRIEENRKAAMERRRAKEEARRKEEALIAEAESMAHDRAYEDVDMEEVVGLSVPDVEDELDREMAEKAARLEALERAEALEREERLIQEEFRQSKMAAETDKMPQKASESADAAHALPSRKSRSQRAVSPTKGPRSPASVGKRTRESQEGQGSPKKSKSTPIEEEED